MMPKKYIVPDEEILDEDYYDSEGHLTPGGMFDAGGHIIGERYAEYIDDLRDSLKERF